MNKNQTTTAHPKNTGNGMTLTLGLSWTSQSWPIAVKCKQVCCEDCNILSMWEKPPPGTDDIHDSTDYYYTLIAGDIHQETIIIHMHLERGLMSGWALVPCVKSTVRKWSNVRLDAKAGTKQAPHCTHWHMQNRRGADAFYGSWIAETLASIRDKTLEGTRKHWDFESKT